MIRNSIINKKEGHIIIYANEPIRIEIIGQYILYGYKGVKINKEQEPDLFYETKKINI